MIYLHTRNPNFGIFWKATEQGELGIFLAIWCYKGQLVYVFNSHLIYFEVMGHIFCPFWCVVCLFTRSYFCVARCRTITSDQVRSNPVWMCRRVARQENRGTVSLRVPLFPLYQEKSGNPGLSAPLVLRAGWPDWANVRPMDDCLLWAGVLKIFFHGYD
jgi:hypothetical protein